VAIRSLFTAVVFVSFAFSATKPAPSAKTGNAKIEMTAALYVDRAAIKELLGSDLDGYFVVVDVRLSSKTGEEFAVSRDDFLLRTDRDGERSKPFAPSQIAGRGALVVNRTSDGGGIGADNRGPQFGGMGMGGPGLGNAGGASRNSGVTAGAKGKVDPLLAVLDEKVLPEKETDQPVSGLLYFPMEPKQKAKDLELTYSGPGSKLLVRFR
jgi:hypothetical protein